MGVKHAGNIFIDQKKIKLSDFGLSRRIAISNNTPELVDVIPYMDPKGFNNKYDANNRSVNYKLNEKSDIYSFGVVMWQISSGRRPFYFESEKYDINLALEIQEGKREKIVDGTPPEYSILYTSWLCYITFVLFIYLLLLLNYFLFYRMLGK